MPDPTPPQSRRRFLRAAAAGGLGSAAAFTLGGHAQEMAPRAPRADVTAEAQAVIDRGLAFLARAQQDDGSYADRLNQGAAVGITSLSGLALMAAGHQPARGRYGRNVSRCVDHLLAVSRQSGNGYLGGGELGGGRFGAQAGMYSHGFGALFLSEVCGMLPDPDRQQQVRAALEQAAAFAVRAQNKDGGWRYEVNPAFADVSVTVAMMMALRAARNAGVFVRKNVIDAGVKFVRACQTDDGGFSYFKGQGTSAFARTAAAVVGLYSAGVYSGRDVERGVRYLLQFPPGRAYNQREMSAQHYFYGHYYAALATWTAGRSLFPGRDVWEEWFPAIRDELVGRARTGPGGVWADGTHGPAYATAMSLIVLQLPNNYLPILQK